MSRKHEPLFWRCLHQCKLSKSRHDPHHIPHSFLKHSFCFVFVVPSAVLTSQTTRLIVRSLLLAVKPELNLLVGRQTRLPSSFSVFQPPASPLWNQSSSPWDVEERNWSQMQWPSCWSRQPRKYETRRSRIAPTSFAIIREETFSAEPFLWNHSTSAYNFLTLPPVTASYPISHVVLEEQDRCWGKTSPGNNRFHTKSMRLTSY